MGYWDIFLRFNKSEGWELKIVCLGKNLFGFFFKKFCQTLDDITCSGFKWKGPNFKWMGTQVNKLVGGIFFLDFLIKV